MEANERPLPAVGIIPSHLEGSFRLSAFPSDLCLFDRPWGAPIALGCAHRIRPAAKGQPSRGLSCYGTLAGKMRHAGRNWLPLPGLPVAVAAIRGQRQGRSAQGNTDLRLRSHGSHLRDDSSVRRDAVPSRQSVIVESICAWYYLYHAIPLQSSL